MSNIKTGLMYSPLTERVYWGKINTKSGVSVGNSKKDITSDFIGIMLQKFKLNTSQNITSNGVFKAAVFVVDKEESSKYHAAKEMHQMLEKITKVKNLERDINWDDVSDLLAKARGENG